MRKRVQPEPSLRINDFLSHVADGLRSRLGDDYAGMETRRRFGYLQLYRGDPGLHYEIWAQRRTRRVEIGLHFETADREWNYAAAGALAAHQPDVLAAVGPAFELEEWTSAWTRLHCSIDAPALTPELAEEAAARAADLVLGMEPLVESLGIRAGQPRPVRSTRSVARGHPKAQRAVPLPSAGSAARRKKRAR
jgi:hypothetical protein